MKKAASPAITRVGPSGWGYSDWEGIVFPRRPAGHGHPLELLAGKFDTVEIASTYERPLRPEIARLYLAKVAHNPNFAFTAVLGRRFTRERCLDAAEVAEFKAGIRPLMSAGRLGCLVLSFPWAFRFTVENREFLIQLRRAFSPFPMAAEMKHASWLAEEALGTLIDYRLGFVNLDQAPHAGAMPLTSIVTSGPACFRLHGRDGRYWLREFSGESGRNDHFYPAGELEEMARRIRRAGAFAPGTFVTLTNSAAGKSVINALQLAAMLREHESAPHRAVA